MEVVFLFIIVTILFGVITEIKYRPRLSYIRSCKRLVLWYNSGGKYDDKRDFIILIDN